MIYTNETHVIVDETEITKEEYMEELRQYKKQHKKELTENAVKQRRKNAKQRYEKIQKVRTTAEGIQDKRVWEFHLNHIRTRARKKNIPFDITPKYIASIAPTHCPIFGFPLQRHSKASQYNSPSIDRIDPSLGYVEGNVLVVSKLANQIKSNASPSQILQVGEFYRTLFEQRGLPVDFDPILGEDGVV